MWPDWVSKPGPLTYESGALPTALRGPAYRGSNSTIFASLFRGVSCTREFLPLRVDPMAKGSVI